MEFFCSKYNPQIKLSSKDILETSLEINEAFAPILALETTDLADLSNLSPEEILEISENISFDFAPKAANNSQKFVLLPVDPHHIHAYWNLSDYLPDNRKNSASKDQLTLRVYSEADQKALTETSSWIDAPSNSASIGKHDQDNCFTAFAHSNSIHIPLGNVMSKPIEENQSAFKSIPEITKVNRTIPLVLKQSSSGQNNN
jgi:hypothetical protein